MRALIARLIERMRRPAVIEPPHPTAAILAAVIERAAVERLGHPLR